MFYQIARGRIVAADQPDPGLQPLAALAGGLTPVQVEDLHWAFQAWGDAGLSPGAVVSARTWADARADPGGKLAFVFPDARVAPAPLTHFGLARELAAWLVLLAKWQPVEVVVARARRVWAVEVLGGALPFATPVFLPAELVAQRPDNWERVAQALALVAAPVAAPAGAGTSPPTRPGSAS